MSTAELKDIRETIHSYVEHASEDMLMKISKLMEAESNSNNANEFYLTPEQKAILEERMRLYESGQAKVSSWEEVKARIKGKKRNAA